jgi:NAD-dependent SIR2 family protein deacetylase
MGGEMTKEQNTEALKKARIFSDNKDKIDGFYNGYVQATIELQKQIEIDAKQIRALQKQKGELTDKVRELEAQIEKMKSCENCGWFYLQQHWRENKEINESRMFHCGTCGNKRNWKLREIKEK